MLWTFLVVGAVGCLIVSLVAREQSGEPVALTEKPLLAWKKAWSLAERAGGRAREAWDRRAAERSRLSFGARFASRDRDWIRTHRVERIGWRERIVALMELILFIVFLSALFAGALAAAALKIGHFHS